MMLIFVILQMTLHTRDKSLNTVLKKLENSAEIAITWFKSNYMKLNTDKCYLLISGYKHEKVFAKLENDKIWETEEVKLLGITIDKDLKFDTHISNVCAEANKKLSVLSRMSKYLSFNKRKLLYNSFVVSQFK